MTEMTVDRQGLADSGMMSELVVEHWTVAMADDPSCRACDSTLSVLRSAADEVAPLLRRLGLHIVVVPRTISTWSEALRYRIVASPTVRVGGTDLVPAHVDASSEERRWTWRGEETLDIQPAAIVDALIRAAASQSRLLDEYLAGGGPDPYLHKHLVAPDGAAPRSGEPLSCGCDASCG